MKIILLEDVKGKGKKDDIINVSDGYGKNYLLKNKLGVLYTDGSKKVLDKEIKNRQDKEDALVSDLTKIKEKLENKNIKFKVKTGKEDKVFGNISTKQISEEIKKLGFNNMKIYYTQDLNQNSTTLDKSLIEFITDKNGKYKMNNV